MDKISCILHGSFGKHLQEIKNAYQIFEQAGIQVLAPDLRAITKWADGFAFFEGQENLDVRYIELSYLKNLKALGRNGFSYFVNPEGYIGRTASYELGIAQTTNTHCYFLSSPIDHPVYLPGNSIWSPENLAGYIREHQKLPDLKIQAQEESIHQLWLDLLVPGSVVATGAIIEHRATKEILLVKTHKWGGRFSIVGGKVRRNEHLVEALLREVTEETQLIGGIGRHLCTFDQIKNSGYYLSGIQHIYVDNIVEVDSKQVELNDEAEDYVWMPAKEALASLDIEPNAKHTLEIYHQLSSG